MRQKNLHGGDLKKCHGIYIIKMSLKKERVNINNVKINKFVE